MFYYSSFHLWLNTLHVVYMCVFFSYWTAVCVCWRSVICWADYCQSVRTSRLPLRNTSMPSERGRFVVTLTASPVSYYTEAAFPVWSGSLMIILSSARRSISSMNLVQQIYLHCMYIMYNQCMYIRIYM